MQRDVQHATLAVEEILGAIAVVDVPVEDTNLARSLLKSTASRDCHRVVEAEPLRPVPGCVIRASMVAGRAHDGECERASVSGRIGRLRCALAQHAERCIDHAATGELSCHFSMGRIVHSARAIGLANGTVGWIRGGA